MQFGAEPLSRRRLEATVDGARECGFAAVSSNDHFVFGTPWLDGPTALASMIGRAGEVTLAPTVSLVVLRGPLALAKSLAAIDVLSEGRLIACLGPGSSKRDYDASGIPFEERWRRFDDAVGELRALLSGAPGPVQLEPRPRQDGGVPLWIGSWGSAAGLRRGARAGDGWLASAYNTTPERFAEARAKLAGLAPDRDVPNALATMWTWVTEDRAEADRMLERVLAPLLNRDAAELRAQVCGGPAAAPPAPPRPRRRGGGRGRGGPGGGGARVGSRFRRGRAASASTCGR